ncbi:MFS transporter [Pseudonocardia spinosispora]|uniref:MFS transporter n=1 Tax=Pseudonocardia spinosispora TaxID=103441 RepID=UPI001FE23C7B|nr:MFS transporter [Pseudonocardia spinosispora]
MRALVPAMGLCVALVVGTVSAINLAIPSLAGGDLHPSATEVLWVVDGYVVVFACLLVPAGALADRLGRKGVLLAGMALFACGTTLCGLAPGITLLVVGRVVSGVGAAAVLPTTLALMLHSVPGSRRPGVIAVWASMTGLAAVLGNLGGGAAVGWGSWRTLFLAGAPLAVVALVGIALAAPRVPCHERAVPVGGAVLLTGGSVSLLYALVSAPQHGWLSGQVYTGVAGAVLLLSGWVVHDLRSVAPLLDPRLFLIPTLRASALGMTVVFVGMFGLMYVNGQYLQYARGCSVLGAGLRLLPMAAGLWLAPRAAVPIMTRFGSRSAVALGLAVLAGGLAAASFVDAHTPTAWYMLCAVGVSTGCGLATPPLSDGIMSALPGSSAGTGSGLQSVARELGSALGVAVVGSVLNARFAASSTLMRGSEVPSTVADALARPGGAARRSEVIDAFTGAMGAGLRVAASIVVVAGIMVVCWLPRRVTVGTPGVVARR